MGYVCCPTLLLLLRLGPDLTISLILCMPRELLFIGMLEKVWKKVNLLKPEKTWQLWKRIMKKLVWIPLTVKVMKERNTRNVFQFHEVFPHSDTSPIIIIYILL